MMRPCLSCGATGWWEQLPPSAQKNRRYCSWDCYKASPKELRYPRKLRTCVICGAPVTSKALKTRTCSSECGYVLRRRQVEVDCDQCGKTFEQFPSELKKNSHKYCSKSCYHAATGREDSPIVTCMECGKTIKRSASQVRRARRHFCSVACKSVCVAREGQALVRHSWGKDGFRADLGHYTRSTWEANVCRVLRRLGIEYSYEPTTFPLGTDTYTPDLLIGNTLVEIKGYWTSKCRSKVRRFHENFPEWHLDIIDELRYRAIQAEWMERIPEWER